MAKPLGGEVQGLFAPRRICGGGIAPVYIYLRLRILLHPPGGNGGSGYDHSRCRQQKYASLYPAVHWMASS